MKVEPIRRRIKSASSGLGFEPEDEYRTRDGTRIDLALFRDGRPFVAVEFERTYKWVRRRILYNAVKAHRAGFETLLMVYPFDTDRLAGSWVLAFTREELEMDVEMVHPDDILDEIERRASLTAEP